MKNKRVVTEFVYEQSVKNRNYMEEAFLRLQMNEEEKELAKKLLDGPISLKEVMEKGLEDLSLAFFHNRHEVYLYPVVANFMEGKMPQVDTLPKGMELTFSQMESLYAGEETANEMIRLLAREDEEGFCYALIENNEGGACFFAGQVAGRLGMPLLVWKAEDESWQELLLTSILYDALICVDAREFKGSKKELADKIEKLSYTTARFMVLLKDKESSSEFTERVRCLFRVLPETSKSDRENCLRNYEEQTGILITKNMKQKMVDGQYSIATIKRILREFEAQAELLGNGIISEEVEGQIIQSYDEKKSELFGIRQMSVNVQLSDLCLPTEQYEQIIKICKMLNKREKVMKEWGFAEKYSYGNGTSVLFYGAPGTGKTMAAMAVAGELGLPLYRVDLSQLISKYIGETQKNIGKIFEQAKKLNGILLFDEADALFARRNEVSDSQDKYSNAETAYLLQRIEECEGICILATNLLHNFDEAFRRRITYMVNFPLPDEQIRKMLWSKVFPKQAEMAEDVDYEVLAQNFELSGAAIKNAAFQAAYEAAVEDEKVGMKHILTGINNEYKKMNKSMKPEQKGLLEKYDVNTI